MREHILIYLDDPDKDVRQAAALACCRVLDRHARAAAAAANAQAAAVAAAAGTDGITAAAAAAAAAAADRTPSLSGPNGLLGLPGAGGGASAAGGGVLLLGGSGAAAAAAAAVGGSLGLGLRHSKMVELAVSKLLMAAVADTSERVRRTVLQVRQAGTNGISTPIHPPSSPPSLSFVLLSGSV